MGYLVLFLVTVLTDALLLVWARAPLQSQAGAVVLVAGGLELSRVVTTPYVASGSTVSGAIAVIGALCGAAIGCAVVRWMGWDGPP